MQIKLFSCHNNALNKKKKEGGETTGGVEKKFRAPKSMQLKGERK